MSLKRLFDIIVDKCNILTKSEQPSLEDMQKTKTSSSKHDNDDETDKPTSSSYHPPVTRSRSASASGTTSRSNSSGSSSSGSSSSGSDSSSSGSSSTDSDASSSSSDTEASRASQRSRASRVSRSSQRSANSAKNAKKGGGQQTTSRDNGPIKHSAPSPRSPQAQPKKLTPAAPSKVTSASATSSTSAPKKKAPPQDQQNSKANAAKPKPKPKPVLSGSVTNEKTISLSSSTPLLLKAKPTSTTQVITTTGGNKKKEVKKPLKVTAASSTDSESDGKPLANLKRAGPKPKSLKQPATKANGKAAPSPTKKTGTTATATPVKKKSVPAEKKKLPTITSRKKDLCLKTIFSPDNSSADEDVLDGDKKKKLTKKMAPDAQKAASLLKKKIRAAAAAANDSNAAAVYSSSVSATSSSMDSTTSSGSDSSSEEPNKRPENAGAVDASSPKSSTGSRGSRKGRPITRRQRGTVKSKTIPTTTVFSHISQISGVTTSHQQQQVIIQSQSPYITRAWGDSDFSDDPSQGAALIRCPTKSSTNRAMRFPTIGSGGEEEFMERKCPFPSCDSEGHLSGKFPSHSLLSTCPKYHDLTLEECKENAEDRAKRDSERRKYYSSSQPHMKKPSKLSQDAKTWLSQMKELKEKPSKRMDGVCSQYDENLWSDALAHAATKIELEQSESISIRSIVIGRFEMACWCESPYAEPLCHSRRIFICEFCLKALPSGTVLRRHCAKCVWRHPPGDEIYRKDRLSVWEVDGKSQKGYCQNLCLLAKSFLDHKTLYLDVDPFLFYVMTLADSQGCHLVGYFSKEKNSFLNYNVSCILTLPPYQRQGFGRLLIDFSYLLTRVEGKVGSPEKPLSDLGLISYRSYWKDAVLRRMCACATREMNVKDLSIELGVTSADLISTLQFLGMLKYWKGKHLVLKKQDVLEEYLERVRRRGDTRQIEPSCLRWRPYQPPVDQSSS